jgi:uncharacterized Fe-S center protein
MKKQRLIFIVSIALFLLVTLANNAGKKAEAQTAGSGMPVQTPVNETATEPAAPVQSGNPKVYFTTDISPAGLMAAYNALGVTNINESITAGKVAVKVHTGESPNSYHLRPDFIKELVQLVNGTIVETNTAYGGNRASTAMHKQLARDHGFTAIANVDILDERGSITLPVTGGTRLTENLVGAHFTNYDYYVVLSHFKGHAMGGFGGAIKNISIGIASSEGKIWIHTGGASKTSFQLSFGTDQNVFLDSMAEAGKSVVDSLNGRILYINVLNNLSVRCDCAANPDKPDMHDIGILSSFDPVAIDQASVDLVYAAPDGKSLIERIESRNGIRTLEHGSEIGLGSRVYDLIRL